MTETWLTCLDIFPLAKSKPMCYRCFHFWNICSTKNPPQLYCERDQEGFFPSCPSAASCRGWPSSAHPSASAAHRPPPCFLHCAWLCCSCSIAGCLWEAVLSGVMRRLTRWNVPRKWCRSCFTQSKSNLLFLERSLLDECVLWYFIRCKVLTVWKNLVQRLMIIFFTLHTTFLVNTFNYMMLYSLPCWH